MRCSLRTGNDKVLLLPTRIAIPLQDRCHTPGTQLSETKFMPEELDPKGLLFLHCSKVWKPHRG